MEAVDRAALLQEVIEIVQRVVPATAKPVRRDSGLLTEFDLDSLQTLELVEIVRDEYSVDLLMPPRSIADLSTPSTLVDAIIAAHEQK